MTHLKISVPVYKATVWETLTKAGKIEVSSDVDNLSEGYEELKKQIEKLLADLDSRARLAKATHLMEEELERKTFALKAIVKDIERATQHYEDLKIFLQAFGVDPNATRLTFDRKFLLSQSSEVEVEVVSRSDEF